MSRSVATSRRPAYTLVVVLVTGFLVLAFTAIMEGLVVGEWGRDRYTMLEAQACQVIASAQAWSRVHATELIAGQPVALPVEELLPTGMTGALELHGARSAGGDTLVECEVRVERAGRHLTRRAVWLAAPGQPWRDACGANGSAPAAACADLPHAPLRQSDHRRASDRLDVVERPVLAAVDGGADPCGRPVRLSIATAQEQWRVSPAPSGGAGSQAGRPESAASRPTAPGSS